MSGMSGKVYFFKGDQYVQVDAGTKKIDSGYPRPITQDWNGLEEIGFDRDLNAAEYIPTLGALVFFKGKNYAKYDLAADKVIEHGAIEDCFKEILPGFHDSLAGVAIYNKTRLYFFQEGYCVYCDTKTLASWSSTAKTVSDWSLGTRYSSLDAVLSVPLDGNFYFFKDGYLSAFRSKLKDVPIASVWLGLDACGFNEGIQAAVYLDKGRQPAVPETNILAVIDTKSIKEKYAGKLSTDPDNPTPFSDADKIGYLFLTSDKNVSSAQASMNLSFSADLRDEVSFRGISIEGNSEDAVIIYNIAHVGEETVFNPFVPSLKTRSKAVVPDPATDNGLPAISTSLNFTSFDSEVVATGTEKAYIDFAIYHLSSDRESQDLVGYGRLTSTITIRKA